MKKLFLLALSIISTFFLTAQTPGTPDLSFGNNGSTLVDFGGSQNYCHASALQPDQKIVLAGESSNTTFDMSFTRLNTDGSLDLSFGSNGILTHVFGASDELIYDVLVQPDGNILATGHSRSDADCSMILVRLTPEGAFDPSFSSDGMLIVDFGPGTESFGEEMVLQEDGKIVTVGHVLDLNGDMQCGICRVNPNGSLDYSFGTNGIVIFDFLSTHNYMNSVALQGNKIVVGGTSYGNPEEYVSIARFTTDGSLDVSFGINGFLAIETNINTWFRRSWGAMCLDSEERIIWGSHIDGIIAKEFAVYRFLEDGTPDNSFGDHGLSVTSLEGDNYVFDITAQYDNKIIAVGGGGGNGSIVRYLENGDPDPGFGTDGNGIIYTETPYLIKSMNIQDDGLILAAGEGNIWSNIDFAATRIFSGLNVSIESQDAIEDNLFIYPNPVTDQTMMVFSLKEPGKVQAEVVNAFGINVASITSKFYPEGEHQLRWNCEELPAGMYVIMLTIGDKTYTSKIIKSH